MFKCNNELHGVHWLTFICFCTLFFYCCLLICLLVTHSCSSLSCSSFSSSSFILVPPHSASLTSSPSSPLPLHVRHFWPMAVVAGDVETRPPVWSRPIAAGVGCGGRTGNTGFFLLFFSTCCYCFLGFFHVNTKQSWNTDFQVKGLQLNTSCQTLLTSLCTSRTIRGLFFLFRNQSCRKTPKPQQYVPVLFLVQALYHYTVCSSSKYNAVRSLKYQMILKCVPSH